MKKLTNLSVNLVQKILPDSFIFCIILAIVVFIVALPVTGLGVIAIVNAFGSSVWGLLSFSMQMALVVVLGTAFATAPPIKKLIIKLAGIPKNAVTAVVFVTLVTAICDFINWGFGLVIGALLAKEVAKKLKNVDYPLLIAASYSAFAVWHAGLSGSIPLSITTLTDGVVANTGGYLTETVSVSDTILSAWNIIMVIIVVVVLMIMNALMCPKGDDITVIDPSLLVDEPEVERKKGGHVNERLENSYILTYIIVAICAVYIIYYFATSGDILNALTLNIVNLIFLTLGMAFHKTPIGYVRAISDAASGAAGVILQFPFYAGIQGMMVVQNEAGVSVATTISNFFVNISTQRTFPVFCYLAAGIVNFFVPSGGGQWAVQGPIMMPAGGELGVSPAVTCMAIAWGDAWTNLLQPFWALPALGIAGLGIKDIMGYCVIDLIAVGIVTALCFLIIVPAFTL